MQRAPLLSGSINGLTGNLPKMRLIQRDFRIAARKSSCDMRHAIRTQGHRPNILKSSPNSLKHLTFPDFRLSYPLLVYVKSGSPMKKVSEANLAANRANAKRSTGPRTPEGKARSSQNARKHVFHPTSFPVVRLEEVDEVDRLRADAIAAYRPANSQETFAVERIVLAQQALLRAERLHSGIFTICLNQTVTDDSRPITAISPVLVNDDFPICRAQNRN